MFDNHFTGNNNQPIIIIYQPTVVVVNENPTQQDKKPEPVKDKPSLLERLKRFLGFGGVVADFIKKVLPIILLALGINSS